MKPSTWRHARWLQTVLAIALGVVWLTVGLEAQRRDIRGRLTDATGAAVAGVSVELVLDGLVERTVVTAADGTFALSVVDLSRGTFQVRISAAGMDAQTVRLTPESRQAKPMRPFCVEI